MNYKKTLGFALLLSLLSTSSFAKGVGASTDLKAWRITDHSAKIAFKDNTQDEDEFWIYVIDDNGKVIQTKEIDASSGTGKMRIAKIGGLKRGAKYYTYVSAYFYKDDYIPVKMNQSEMLEFKTKGEPENYDGKIAKELKAWSIKKTSAVITFNANPKYDLNQETDDFAVSMIFINTETGKYMTRNSKGQVKLPSKNPNKTYYAVKLINLEPGTTYTAKLLFDRMVGQVDTDTMITFTTKE